MDKKEKYLNKLLIVKQQPSITFSIQNTQTNNTRNILSKKRETNEILVANHNVLITYAKARCALKEDKNS